MLPTRHFYEKFTDSVRIWVNETSSPEIDVREGVEIEIPGALEPWESISETRP